MLGQINRGSIPGETIKLIASSSNVLNIVEIGTWNGRGSTQCVLDGMREKNPACSFYTLECDKEQYDLAQEINPKVPNIHFIHGTVVNIDELNDKDLKVGDGLDEPKWLQQDKDHMAGVPNVLEELPDKIDFLILDGGEFSGRGEFLKLKDRAFIIFLDDIQARKNRENYEELSNDPNFVPLIVCPIPATVMEVRGNWAIFIRLDGDYEDRTSTVQ